MHVTLLRNSLLTVCVSLSTVIYADSAIAPGAPGQSPFWSYSGKTGIGTSYEQYHNGAYSSDAPTGPVSKVWFSLANGIVTETMFGLIHEAQLRAMQVVVKGPDFIDLEETDTVSETQYLSTDNEGRPASLAYRIINRAKNGQYRIEKHVFTDPDSDALVMRVIFHSPNPALQAYLHVDPAMNNSGSGDRAFTEQHALYAQEQETTLVVKASRSLESPTVGFVGASDGLEELRRKGSLESLYTTTGDTPGNVAMMARLPRTGDTTTIDIVVGFGRDRQAADQAADKTLKRGYEQVLAHYNGEGDTIGWQDYLASLTHLAAMRQQTTDNGKLLNVSAMVLKAQEDKTHAGALIASLSNPWGETVPADKGTTGYKAVWPRDFYQCAMALLALGDTQTSKVAFEYLKQVQVTKDTPPMQADGSAYIHEQKQNDSTRGAESGATGWFLQKTHVDGTIEWVGVQLDQTAMPIMLGYKLWKSGVLSNADITRWYQEMLKPAADFLTQGGQVKLGWNDWTVKPPQTQQDRWEEQWGYSPSTTAAVITGLVTASELATQTGDMAGAKAYLDAARRYSNHVEPSMFTQQGIFGDKQYYLRITQNDNPNDGQLLLDNNSRPGLPENQILDAGFLELVRYGVRSATDPHIVSSLSVLDDQTLPENLKVKYTFTYPGVSGEFPGWRRYGNDGYGESETTGINYPATEQPVMNSGLRGRVWPIFTGERGHYALALAKAQQPGGENTLSNGQLRDLQNTYVKAMELFANEGFMLPEQVWDGVGNNERHHYTKGKGTDSATPLAWSHAEYVKLVRSLSDQNVWDRYPIVSEKLQP
ncbi:glucan 14-alpha-glucosidase Cga [Pseudomonas asuensis]|uniref:Glucan 14-alpha-glucosidase Cga n=1 Tax=Pseudomonas asuensis TaxID=1825787 RepID=A0ABQ2GYQ0_9PSED|nr:glucan 1,4-alpha-glucosidase [Pseudomonas asuensis]GGM18747.1 glucan 14-alpha-glucosidase Cga [Pseudomonas asuensis]